MCLRVSPLSGAYPDYVCTIISGIFNVCCIVIIDHLCFLVSVFFCMKDKHQQESSFQAAEKMQRKC